MRLKRFTVLVGVALAVECTAQAPPCSLEELARVGGAFASVSSNGETAIVSVADRLLVMDVSDPTNPVEVGQLAGFEGVWGHRMADSLAFVLVDDELRVIDLSDPTSPIQVGAVTPFADERAWDRPAVDGSTVYLVYGYARPATTIVSIDIADPAHPVVVDSIDGPQTTRAYLSAGGGVVGCSLERSSGDNQVWFIDASDSADLKSASFVDTSPYAEDLACNGSIACVFNFIEFHVYDTSNPYQPSFIGGAVHWSWHPGEIELAGEFLFGSVTYEASGALLAFDMVNPAQPMPLGQPVGWGPWSVAPSGPGGALMLDENALKAVSVDPTLAVVGTYQSVGGVFEADVEGDHLVFSADTGVYFYDVSNPLLPVMTGSVTGFWGLGSQVRIEDDLAYLSEDPGLQVFDLSPPTGPKLISTTAVPTLYQIDVDGSVGIGASWSNPASIVVFDLSDPTRPVVSQAMTLPTNVDPKDVAIEGGIALVAADTLYVLDVSDPSSPRVVSSLLSRADQVALENGIGYVSARPSGAGTIIDLSDPANPIAIGTIPVPWLMDLAVNDDLLYASLFRTPELWVFDVTDPKSLSVVSSFNAPYQTRDVAVDDFGKVALARGGNGLSLLEACRPCYPDCDQTTGQGVLDIFDFLCFQSSFVSGEPYACDCAPDPACDIFDFLCFQDAFVAGCP